MAVKPSFANHIRQMFRDNDVNRMSFMFDLANYDEVKAASDEILKCLKGEGRLVMPPEEEGGPWPAEWITLFERWINEGHGE